MYLSHVGRGKNGLRLRINGNLRSNSARKRGFASSIKLISGLHKDLVWLTHLAQIIFTLLDSYETRVGFKQSKSKENSCLLIFYSRKQFKWLFITICCRIKCAGGVSSQSTGSIVWLVSRVGRVTLQMYSFTVKKRLHEKNVISNVIQGSRYESHVIRFFFGLLQGHKRKAKDKISCVFC